MIEPEIDVHITGYAFSIGEIRMAADADVYIECDEDHTGPGAVQHTLRATTASKQ